MIISVTLGNVQEGKYKKWNKILILDQRYGSSFFQRTIGYNLVPRVFSLSNMPPYWKARRPWGRGCNWVMKQERNDPKQGHQSKNNSR